MRRGNNSRSSSSGQSHVRCSTRGNGQQCGQTGIANEQLRTGPAHARQNVLPPAAHNHNRNNNNFNTLPEPAVEGSVGKPQTRTWAPARPGQPITEDKTQVWKRTTRRRARGRPRKCRTCRLRIGAHTKDTETERCVMTTRLLQCEERRSEGAWMRFSRQQGGRALTADVVCQEGEPPQQVLQAQLCTNQNINLRRRLSGHAEEGRQGNGSAPAKMIRMPKTMR